MNTEWINKTIPMLVGMLVMLVAILVSIMVVAFYPYDPLRVDKIILSSTSVARGEQICFKFEGERYYDDLDSKVTVEMVNGEAFHIMSYESVTNKGTQFKPRCFIVPMNINPCKSYQIRWTGVFNMNPLNHPKKQFLSEPIEVR